MIWILLAILSQLISAGVYMADKYLVGPKAIGRPVVYAIYVCLLSGFVLVLLPFGVVLPLTWPLIALCLGITVAFTTSLLFLYSALKTSDVSDVAPVMGAISAVATLAFGLYLLNSFLPRFFFVGFPILIFGTFLMSRFRFNKKSSFYVIAAGILFGLSSVLIKILFGETSFLNAFFWSRMTNVFGAIILLLWPANFKAVFSNVKSSTGGTKILIVGNKTLAGIAYLLSLVAIKLGNVTVVNSLAGFEFVFILLLAFIFTYKFPKYFQEAVHNKNDRRKKLWASGLIIVGFIIMFL
jgi:drug/metabolite transporter (DMT)-like permease